jgi:hypothetical protein
MESGAGRFCRGAAFVVVGDRLRWDRCPPRALRRGKIARPIAQELMKGSTKLMVARGALKFASGVRDDQRQDRRGVGRHPSWAKQLAPWQAVVG